MSYLLHILIIGTLFFLLAASLNLISGYAGILSIAHAAFYGVGAYTAALIAPYTGGAFSVELVLCLGCGVILGVLVSLPALQMEGDELVVATFAFQVCCTSILRNWTEVTNGPSGIAGIPPLQIADWPISSRPALGVVVLLTTGILIAALHYVASSPFGRTLKAIREDERLSVALGKNVARFKIITFALGGGLAAVAGMLYAHYATFIDPSSFTVETSILIISIVIIGGAGRLSGALLGTLLLVAIPELFRFIDIEYRVVANIRRLMYGLLLVGFLLLRPEGLVKGYRYRERESL